MNYPKVSLATIKEICLSSLPACSCPLPCFGTEDDAAGDLGADLAKTKYNKPCGYMQESKPRYGVHKCFHKPDGSLARPSDFIWFYLHISFIANFYCMSNEMVLLLSALVIVFPHALTGMLADDGWPQAAV